MTKYGTCVSCGEGAQDVCVEGRRAGFVYGGMETEVCGGMGGGVGCVCVCVCVWGGLWWDGGT